MAAKKHGQKRQILGHTSSKPCKWKHLPLTLLETTLKRHETGRRWPSSNTFTVLSLSFEPPLLTTWPSLCMSCTRSFLLFEQIKSQSGSSKFSQWSAWICKTLTFPFKNLLTSDNKSNTLPAQGRNICLWGATTSSASSGLLHSHVRKFQCHCLHFLGMC